MKRRILGLVLVLCFVVSLVPVLGLSAAATVESAAVTLNTRGGKVTLEASGSDAAYAITDAAGNATVADAEPADNYIKLAIEEGIATLYLKNAVLEGGDNVIDLTAVEDHVNIVVLGDSKITTNNNGIVHRKKDLSIAGPGKLSVWNPAGAGSAILVTAGGNLVFAENANVDIATNTGRCIFVDSGSLTTKGNVKMTGMGATLVEVMNDMTVEQGSFAVTPTVQGTYVKLGNLIVNGGKMSVIKGGGLGDSMTWAIEVGNVTLNGGTLQTNIGRALECRGKVVFNGGKHDLKTGFSNKLVSLITAQSITFNGGEVELYAHGQSNLSNVEMKVGAAGGYVAKVGVGKMSAQSISGNAYPMNNMLCYGYFALPINEFTTMPSIEGWSTDDPAAKPACEALYGKVEFWYATAADGEYTKNQPVMAGTYYMKAIVPKGTQVCGGFTLGYEAIESEPVMFVIEQGEYVPQPTEPETEPTQSQAQPGDSATKPGNTSTASGSDALTWVVIAVAVVAVAVAGFAAWMVLSSRKKGN